MNTDSDFYNLDHYRQEQERHRGEDARQTTMQPVNPRPDNLHLVPVDIRYPGVWDTLYPYLYTAIGENLDWDEKAVEDAALNRQIQIWALVREDSVFGIGVTKLTPYPKRLVMEIIFMASDPHTEELWQWLLLDLKDIAKQTGCSHIIGTGRPGWARKLEAVERRIFEVEL